MIMLKKYLKIMFIYYRVFFRRDLGFRLSFFTALLGAFCYVGLYFFTIFFLMKKLSFGRWGSNEMWVLLGCFYIFVYGYFFLFWRGLNKFIGSIKNGFFDVFLLKPIDTQFLISATGGSIHNFLAIVFGIFVLTYGASHFVANLTLGKIFLVPVLLCLSIMDFFALSIMLSTLNFKYGDISEVLELGNSFQDFSRYPTDAFSRLPIFLLVFALPASALTTIPALVIIEPIFPTHLVGIFVVASVLFIGLSRWIFYRSVRGYTSGS